MDGNSWKRIDPQKLSPGMSLSNGQIVECKVDGQLFQIMIGYRQQGGVGYMELLGRSVVESAATAPPAE